MYGLLGKKLSHSFSKTIHEQFTNTKYELIETSSLDQFFKTRQIEGINVTIPYKNKIIPYLDELSPEAREINAVNAVISRNGKLLGYNTDYYGLNKTLDYYNIKVKDQTIIILGNGSTSKTISYYCKKNLAKKVIILARNPKSNEYNLNKVDNFKSTTIVFNATPVGMFPNNNQGALVELSNLPNLTSVVDVIYNPIRSNLLIAAEELKLTAVNGLLMLIYQAVESIKLFHNIHISDVEVIDYYHKLQFKKQNLVFIGMPMSGKTFLSNLTSKKYNKNFVDIDEEITIYTRDSIENTFKNQGEDYFRNVESNIISKYSKLNNQAISCGGGVILNKENMVNLKQNGIIIFIDMPLTLLKKCNPRNRPLLKDKSNIERLYSERYRLYKSFADITIHKTSFNEKAIMRQIEVNINEYISTKWS
ncbi:Shikimate dehydrogenase [Candidatus Izimaplasma bacterium HR1]|jgi:shikimate dehydrogenase|uniref:shikimate kinase n=1 Tax=Candidatus Izimoplasma sp. HR1 TaxID=1541959 RepID=UPI0004F63DD3|nr:Shikimate dehydrogenase [Candidatus Izimaplasma bacterium HR1]